MTKKYRRTIVIAALGIMLFIANRYAVRADPLAIKDWILSFGVLASSFYVALLAIRPLTFFPASVLTVIGGLAFGPVKGFVFTLIGACLGAALTYLLVDKFRVKITRKPSARIDRLKKRVENKGFRYLLLLRVLPVLNFDLVSYGSAVANIPFKRYMLATFLGIIPGTVAYTFLGSSILSGKITVLIGAVLLLVLLLATGYLFARKKQKQLL